MKIIVLNGSPKGQHSITLQYINYLQKKFNQHQFQIFHVAQKIKKLEKDESYFNELIENVKASNAVIWSFGLWVLAVSAQYMRFIELISERSVESAFENKYAAAISTSIRFYDHTAHNYIRSVCDDLNMKFTEANSFYLLDLMNEKKRSILDTFFQQILLSIKKQLTPVKQFKAIEFSNFKYQPGKAEQKIISDKKILVLTEDHKIYSNLEKMIYRFSDSFQQKVQILSLKDINIKGACLGCMKCGYDYQCQYNDGFTEFYNKQVRNADILIFAGEMKGRYLSSLWKTFFDRAFFWNHTPSLKGKQIAYLISGPISQNTNLQQILEGNVTARQFANLVGIISDESEDSKIIDSNIQYLAEQAVFYASKEYVRPDNFLGIGGHKIFRDEIFGHIRSVWQADHKYYQKNGLYDFEQKKTGLRIMNFFLLLACKIPQFRKKYYNNIMKFPAKRFGKVLDKLVIANKI